MSMKKRILVVDDDRVTLAWLRDLLLGEGYEVTTAESGLEGLRLAQEMVPDLIVLDVILPDVDGFEVCRRMRRDPRLRETQVVMLTSKDEVEDIMAGFRVGANDYIPKRPGADRELLAKVRTLLAHPQRWGGDFALEGRLVTFFSPRGGCGVSTLCANMAVLLSQGEHGKVLVLDLVSPFGSLADLMGAKVQPPTPVDMWAAGKGMPDRESVRRSVVHLDTWGVDLLPGSMDHTTVAERWWVEPLLEAVSTMYDVVLVDVGHALDDAALSTMGNAHQVVFILGNDHQSLRLSKRVLPVLASMGVSGDRIFALINQAIGRGRMSKTEIEEELGIPIVGTVPFGSEPYVTAADQGMPFVLSHPQHVTTMVLYDLRDALQRVLWEERS